MGDKKAILNSQKMKHLHGLLMITFKGFSRSRLWHILMCISSTEKEYEYHRWAAGPPAETEHRDGFRKCQVSTFIHCYPLLYCYPTECRLQQFGAETMHYHHHHHHHQQQQQQQKQKQLQQRRRRRQQQQQQQQQRLLKPSLFMTVYMLSGVYFLSSSIGYIRKLVMDCGFRCSGI